MPDAFYVPDGDRYLSTELTRGPWDPGSQHAGPPAALIGREIERLEGFEEFQVARITFEILRAVPIAPVRVEAQVLRPGRRVQLVEATLAADDGPIIRARAWGIRPRPVELPRQGTAPEPVAGPETGSPGNFFATGETVGYHTAMEYRFLSGDFTEPGPATVWMRTRHPIVAAEVPTPLQRVLVAADTGNGVSASLDWKRFIFINVDLTVQLERLPAGEWICLDAVTRPEPNGVGSSDTVLHDESGRIGRALQTLLVDHR